MGNPISPIIAIIYMYDLEERIIFQNFPHIVWMRYIDDIFFLLVTNQILSSYLILLTISIHILNSLSNHQVTTVYHF